jgi:transposase
MDLTHEQWEILEPLIPTPPRREDGRGRSWRDPRDVLNGILWILRTGAPWKDLPQRYPPYQTCHRRFQRWIEGFSGQRARSSGRGSRRAGRCTPEYLTSRAGYGVS